MIQDMFKMNQMFESFSKYINKPFAMHNPFSNVDITKQFSDLQEQYGHNMNEAMNNWQKMFMPAHNKPKMDNNVDSLFSVVMQNIKNINQISQDMAQHYQGIVKKKAEMIQNHSSDVFNLMKKMVSSPNSEATLSLQNDFVKKSFEKMMQDFHQLGEMSSKCSIETAEKMNKKVSESVQNFQDAVTNKSRNKTKK